MASRPNTEPLLRALVAPAGTGDHIVTLANGWSSSVTVRADGTFDVEHPRVIARLAAMTTGGDACGVILRTFTQETAHTLPNGVRIPVKEVRGWYLDGGTFQPLDEQAIFAAMCTDADTREPTPPERGVRYSDAYPVVIPAES